MTKALDKGWIDFLQKQEANLVTQAALWMDKLLPEETDTTLFQAIGQGSEESGQKNFAQYFTPPDVALAAAFSLPDSPVFDPAAGKGSLLISAGVSRALKGVRGTALLKSLHGIEICPTTHQAMLDNIAKALEPWHGLSIKNAKKILSQTITVQDFHNWNADISDKVVLMNPPYKEQKGKNQWILFMDKILDKKPKALCAILPISITCSGRAQIIRDKLKSYKNVRAFHHEIRPRPLFPKVEQRITILTLRNDLREGYQTTGFLTHRSKTRAAIWSEKMIAFNRFNPDAFLKVSHQTLPFYHSQKTGTTLKEMDALEPSKQDIWIRISGRYTLVAQKQTPKTITSKWKRLHLSAQAADEIIKAFDNGGALLWWRMFGDGRDFPIRQFLENWKVQTKP